MTFDAFETSDGQPVELLTFANGTQVFRRTNANKLLVVGPNTFLPLAYTRSAFSQSNDTDDSNVNLTTPGDFEVVGLYSGAITSSLTSVTIQRFHLNDPANELQILWKGNIVSIQRVDTQAEMLLQPLSSGKEETPRDTYQSLCNSFLFESPGCTLTRTDWRFQGLADAIDSTGFLITVNGLRAQAAILDTAQGGPTGPLSSDELDTYWQAGIIETGAGEIRDVVEGNVGGNPDVVRIISPFRDLNVTDPLDVFAGCVHTIEICHKKFDNAINHQGFPNVPEVDPSNTELPVGTRTSSGGFA